MSVVEKLVDAWLDENKLAHSQSWLRSELITLGEKIIKTQCEADRKREEDFRRSRLEARRN